MHVPSPACKLLAVRRVLHLRQAGAGWEDINVSVNLTISGSAWLEMKEFLSRSLLVQVMLPLQFPFSAWAFEQFTSVCTLQVMSLALFLVTQLQTTKDTVLEETSGGLCRLHFGAEAYFSLPS